MTESVHFALELVGVGSIASYWLDHFAAKLPAQVHITGLHSSRQSWTVTAPASELPQWRQHFAAAPARQPLAARLANLVAQGWQPIVVDLTASKAVSRCYPTWFSHGADIISANKYAGSSHPEFYQQVRSAQHAAGRRWLYNTTVGAGLPIQQALRERLACHDQIQRIEGNLSGSLSWIFQHYRPGDRLSDWVQQAAQLGFTEPDPRLDLSGMDVARKLLILGRDAGWQLALADIQVQSLVPSALAQVSLEQFWLRRHELDQAFEQWRQQHAPTAQQFAYLGVIEPQLHGVSARAALTPIDAYSTYAQLPAGSAHFAITSAHYLSNPLIIQGPGAGREVTAAGVHSDILACIQNR